MPMLSDVHDPDYDVRACKRCGKPLPEIFSDNLRCEPAAARNVVSIEYLRRKVADNGAGR